MILERLVFQRYPDLLSLLGAAIIVGSGVKVALEKSKLSSVKNVRTDEEERKAEEGALLRRMSEDELDTEAQAVDAVEGARR